MLKYQDNRLRYQPNSILSKDDGIYQLAALTTLRALLSRFWDNGSSNGPFVLTLADMHRSNILVDDDWNITRLIDLEFAPVRPIQMAQVPYWLTGMGCDQLTGTNLTEYKVLHDKFVRMIEEEELATKQSNTYSRQLRSDLDTGRFWYILALESLNAFPLIVERHLTGIFDKFRDDEDGSPLLPLALLWDDQALEFIAKKLEDFKNYEDEVRQIFAAAAAKACGGEKIAATASTEVN
jgi:hypothetical protein